MELPSDGQPMPGMSPSRPVGGHLVATGSPDNRLAGVHAAKETGSIARLAAVTQWFLVGCIGTYIAATGVEIFGIVTLTNYIDGDDSALDLLDTYDQLSLVVSALSLLPLVGAVVTWVIWQYRVAKRVSGQTRRSPGWHAGSWFIPVVSLWYPYQNISDLWRATGSHRPPWQVTWWTLGIASNCFALIGSAMYAVAEYAETLRESMWLNIASTALLLVAAPLAILLVRGITRGVLR